MKKDKIYTVYFIKLSSKKEDKKNPKVKNEICYKIGLSKHGVESRLSDYKVSYDVDVIETLELPEEAARRCENSFKSDHYSMRYTPLKKIRSGKTEIFRNKNLFRINGYLSSFWSNIDNNIDKAKFYKDKEERAEISKARYYKYRGWK